MIASALLLLQAASPLAVAEDFTRPDADVLHYEIALTLSDSAQDIRARTTVRYLVTGGDGPLELDFDSVLVVDSVTGPAGRIPAAATHHRGSSADPGWQRRRASRGWVLSVPLRGDPGDTLAVTVHYWGRPRDGLYLRTNSYGAPTVFADNWPDRAHYWFPCDDHPSDKATVAFTVEVPPTWRAVANGRLEGVDTLPHQRTRWRWRSTRPIPTYTMVVGAGRLAVTALPTLTAVPQSLWTFPEDSAFAVQGPFRRATLMVDAYTKLIGAFPYSKLAHVESSTRFGGMENSSAIFYAESPYVDRSMSEDVVAHETAHQWFGDAVTERDWHHLWLSEGFASYFGPLFYELVQEPARFREVMERNRRVYMASDVVERPIIDTTEKNISRLLNENNYPKGAWVLHLLRREVGDSAFFAGIRAYYSTFRDSTALSADLAAVMERFAERPLDWFFQQWLLQPGYPRLDLAWSYEGGELALEIRQTQPAAWGFYRVRLPVDIELENGARESFDVEVEARAATVLRRALPAKPTRLVPDAEGVVLAETSVTAR
ncbi:MAG: M1 family metallopeptidase [Gemmatimonadetes bacterium]|nr:M1 family metallopeptidase [Gemmatimonadota bacterium]